MMSAKHREYRKAAPALVCARSPMAFPASAGAVAAKGWSYFDVDGVRIADPETRERLNALVIMPAWIDVSRPPLHSRHSLAHHPARRGNKRRGSKPIVSCSRHTWMKGTSKNPNFSSGQPKGYPTQQLRCIPTAALLKNLLTYISIICGAAQIFSRLAFGRTLNF